MNTRVLSLFTKKINKLNYNQQQKIYCKPKRTILRLRWYKGYEHERKEKTKFSNMFITERVPGMALDDK